MNSDNMSKRFLIIDGNSLINRAYFAIQRPMITKEGLYTHAVYGFLTMLTKLKTDFEPGYWTVAFDRKAPTFRHLEYQEYKAGRKGMPPELAMQLPILKDVLHAMRMKTLELDGFEADDILGTMAKRGEEQGFEPLIITGDRDALQLASQSTTIILTKKGISEFERYDAETMHSTYGFSPKQFIDFKGLMGDPSDNIPGLPGVGEKTAHKLILQFGSVENLLANTDQIESEKLRRTVEENATIALMSRRLAEIDTNVPIDLNVEDFVVEEPDFEQLVHLYQTLEFNNFLKKLPPRKPIGPKGESAAFPIADRKDLLIHKIQSVDELLPLRNELERAKEPTLVLKVFSDDNHKDKPIIQGISLMVSGQHYFLETDPNEDLVRALIDLLEQTNPSILGHHLQSDYYALMTRDTGQWEPKTVLDSAIAVYLLDPAKSNYDLRTISLEYLHLELASPAMQERDAQLSLLDVVESKLAEDGAIHCDAVHGLFPILMNQMESEGLLEVYQEIELPLIHVLASMEVEGFPVNQDELEGAGKELSGKIQDITDRIFKLSGEPFNINSPKQLGEILFEKLKLPVAKKNKTGYSTNAETLEGLRDQHEIIDLILEYRMLTKLKSTYVEGLLPLIHKDRKIHAHFQQTVAATGRISCTEPNLQNIPIRQEQGRKLRKAFIPASNDYVLLGADYSQIELRVLAHMSQDPSLIEAFREHADIHRATAARVFGVPEEEVTSLQRSNAKAVNFGVIYGMSGFGLSTELKISRREAEQYIEEYFRKYQKVKEFMDKQVADCKEKGYVTTIMNRKRPIPEIHASNFMVRQAGERLAMNSPIQGSAADIIKRAMILCYRQLKRENRIARLILQVHDELILQVPKEELDPVKELLIYHMENAIPMDVTLSVDVNTGDNWYELK